MAAWLSLPLAWLAGRRVFGEAGRTLNHALADTGRLTLAFSILLAAGTAAGVLVAG